MDRMTAEDFVADFERVRRLAQHVPVIIENEDGNSLVLISAGAYARLAALDTRRVYRPNELPDDLREALERADAPAWTSRFDSEVDG